ncbi:hypothetical protein [Streptomyces sp. NBC_01353]|uniref:hypothetical protein n=1 Tax=Streptomyces sp. NBC_01353 TaxID=2903835 RepID=UPI002E2F64F2|nr:hypothetical protein [Streptomyces sp. NBC_01353]
METGQEETLKGRILAQRGQGCAHDCDWCRGDVLGEALLGRKQHIADLQQQLNQMEAERNAERKPADELAAADRQPLRTDAWMAAERVARRSASLAAFGNGHLQTAPVELAPSVIYERREDQHATPSDA